MKRREFLMGAGSLATGAVAGGNTAVRLAVDAADRPAVIHLDRWEVVPLVLDGRKTHDFLKITAKSGTSGYCKLGRGIEGIPAVSEAVAAWKSDLLDHEALYDRMAESSIPVEEAKRFDIACWDLHARMIGKPLHALLGTRRKRILRYGDVRGKQPDFSPAAYARKVAEGYRSPIGDGTSFDDMVRWYEAGAIDQCSTDIYIRGSVTHALRMIRYASEQPPGRLVINLHWSWAPHAHLVMACDERVCPVAEFPGSGEIPAEYLHGPFLKAPDWPGIYPID